MEKITGAQAIVQCLKEEGVRTIFGYPGGAVLDLYDALYESDINDILVRHEQGAVHAADAYARTSGQVGVAVLTSGPGATNGVTGIATAYADSVPMVILTGQVPRAMIGNDAFQEVDIVGISRPCTKHNYLVGSIEELVPTLREAFYIARTGRPGPVLVDLPKDLQSTLLAYPDKTDVRITNYAPNRVPQKAQIEEAAKRILAAERPVLYVGGGATIANANSELTELARKLQIPVTTTLMALGVFPGSDPLFMGMLGMHGTYTANMAVAESDLLIAVGARFDDRVTGKVDDFAAKAEIIHIDIDPTSISKNVKVDLPIIADCKQTVGALNQWFDTNTTPDTSRYQQWHTTVKSWQTSYPLTYHEDETVIKPQYVLEVLQHYAGEDAIITTEVGQNQMWAAQFYTFDQPRHFITSGGLGTMGYGLPAAIGAKIAFPNRNVIDVAGDGSIQMNIQELATAKQHNCPVKVLILNNNYLGMVRQWQEFFYDKRYSATTMDVTPDFVALAEAYGALGLRATTKAEVEPVIKEAMASEKTVLMDIKIAREEDVYPMVPAGKATTEMLLV